jgi:alanyl-tRNA synthetase
MSVSGNEIRKKYLDFMAKKAHAIVPSSPLVPENDPTTLFTGSGMQPMLPYLLGETHPMGTRVADSQKCFRAEDIEEVGDNRHTTFFEMLGNWSFGDYGRENQIRWMFEFLVDEVKLNPNNFYVTVFGGDEKNGLPKDTEAPRIWQELFAEKGVVAEIADIGSEAQGYERGIREGERIFYYEAKKNWWSRSGVPEKMPIGEPGGGDSEMFYDFGTPHDEKWGRHCHPNCDCGRFMEIGNNVFMEYLKTGDTDFTELKSKNIDFGGGLERIAAAVNNEADVFKVDLLYSVIQHAEELSGKKYEDNLTSFRIIADHIRGAVFMIGDDVMPSNGEQGYFVRRLIRRAVRYADILGIKAGELKGMVDSVVKTVGHHYTNLGERQGQIESVIALEEEQFRKTLEHGLKQFNKISLQIHVGSKVVDGKRIIDTSNPQTKRAISAQNAFELFTTYGFPIELTEEIAAEKGLIVERQGFDDLMKKHKEISRAGAEQKFAGGLADHSDQVIQYHTTHHILLRALQMVLGGHVKQRGSNITGERLRIDFLHDEKMTDEQRREVEKIVNEKIAESLPVTKSILPREEAERLGAEHEFGAKYPEMVSVYSIGPKGATVEDPKFADVFSIEFCGGPHVSNTADIKGVFKIQKEESSSSGVRRIKAILK